MLRLSTVKDSLTVPEKEHCPDNRVELLHFLQQLIMEIESQLTIDFEYVYMIGLVFGPSGPARAKTVNCKSVLYVRLTLSKNHHL